MEVSSPLPALATLPPKQLDRKLGELQSQSVCSGKEIKFINAQILYNNSITFTLLLSVYFQFTMLSFSSVSSCRKLSGLSKYDFVMALVISGLYPPVQWVLGVLSLEVKRAQGVTLTTHSYLVPRS
jgi:hypothetical protein